ncbi:GNAT family N-acetyltransferase [Rugamonas sp. CCM 8940]|uniref:GNAT family N-acetyltransferase n=1 Tax=Rugamonas sp. CCM 8940 TaxID=2765359 RepID=UPI0018F523C1|nr:GNAT family N-acetyltransferase [Rugamonas sp. CCM 8940]MBJ7313314.1 GNAT family N-acetyltransferase [Rugamonas sp. CCM 8940]
MNTEAAMALLTPAPWDQAAFGLPAWELAEYSAAALALADVTPGIQTAKIEPLADKRALQQHGFYYVDTLLETAATAAQLRTPATAAPAGLSVVHCAAPGFNAAAALAICHGAFAHGRFQRDLNMDQAGARRRYDGWLSQLIAADAVYGLYADGQLAGFIGHHGHSLVLHAVAPAWRGRGLAKHWWHMVALQLFDAGHERVTSSISAANVAVLNLYASLGFSFGRPQDIYHRIVK